MSSIYIVQQTKVSFWPKIKFAFVILVLCSQVAWAWPYKWSKHEATLYDITQLVVWMT